MELRENATGGEVIDARDTMYPSLLSVVANDTELSTTTSTFYGYVLSGAAHVKSERFEVRLGEGGYFCAPGPLTVGPDGVVALIERLGFRGLSTAGALETTGRLSYIDGCSDTILCAPPRLGDPVLNHLHFPPGIRQTQHTHPSIRLGVVARGKGVAFGPDWEKPLQKGDIFLLRPQEVHSFRTDPGHSMDVVAYHPDSDWGPTDHAHPMLNRTYLQGR